jgi:hypothetical protein
VDEETEAQEFVHCSLFWAFILRKQGLAVLTLAARTLKPEGCRKDQQESHNPTRPQPCPSSRVMRTLWFLIKK